jgi:hypothetical protein
MFVSELLVHPIEDFTSVKPPAPVLGGFEDGSERHHEFLLSRFRYEITQKPHDFQNSVLFVGHKTFL